MVRNINIPSKVLRILIISVLILFSFSNVSFANVPKLVFLDNNGTDYLNDSEQKEIRDELERLSKKHNSNFVIVFKNDVSNPESFTIDYITQNIGVDKNSAVLLLDMEQRSLWIEKKGISTDYVSYSEDQKIFDAMIDNGIGDYQYYKAIKAYLKKLDYYHRPNFVSIFDLLIALGSGLVVSGSFIGITKSQYKSKKSKNQYQLKNNAVTNFNPTKDVFIKEYTTSRIISTNNSGGGTGRGGSSGSSGRSSGGFSGSGRRF